MDERVFNHAKTLFLTHSLVSMFVFPDSDSDRRGRDSNSVDDNSTSSHGTLGGEVNCSADREENDANADEDVQELPSLLSSVCLHGDDDNDSIGGTEDDGKLGFDDDNMSDDIEEERDETRDDLVQLTVKQLKVKLVERGLIQSGNKPDLIERLLDPQPTDFKSKPKVEQWRNSKAKALLLKLLSDHESPFNMLSPEDAWESSEWFMQYPKERFISNMKRLKTSLAARDEVAQNDNETIARELAQFASNLPEETLRGYPLWHNHDASRLLEEDLKNDRNKDMFPEEFQQTRPEYCEFPLFVFRKHIYQEQRKQREMPMKIAKRNKLAAKQHQKEVEDEAARWHADRQHDDEVEEMYELTRD